MAQQPGDDDAPPVQRLIEATRICYCESMAPAGKFAVSVACLTTRSVEFWRRGGGDDDEGPRDVIEHRHNPDDPIARFPVADLAALESDAACRATLRGMLASIPQLRALRVAEDEWDAVVLAEIVQLIVDAAGRGYGGFTVFFKMKVHRRIIVDEGGLLMACKERLPASAAPPPGEKDDDCAICFEPCESAVVELPGCGHAFHGQCIAEWFSQVTTCPMCRGDVLLSALPKLIELSSTADDAAEPAQGTTALPDTASA